MPIMSVIQVTRHIKALLDGDDVLHDLWVEGEISNYTRAASGHCYFTLKDAEAELRCVMWRGQAAFLRWHPAQGDWVEAHGYISVYERGGAYQFYAETLERGGVGALWRQFEELRARLEAEGLFDAARKRTALPRWPKRIGVVTSPTGAAFQDILRVLRARYPLVEVVLSPSLVQGLEAPRSLVQALDALNQQPDIDLVIVARGGGSVQELWAFNDERVARAIAASRAPVISGVGHEVDFTIADFVADVRAPTPTAAAALATPDQVELRAQIGGMVNALAARIGQRIERLREALAREQRALRLRDPRRRMAEYRQHLDELRRRKQSAIAHCLDLRQMRLERYRASLQALNPSLVLRRGYALVEERATGERLRSAMQVTPGQDVVIHIHDGRIGATVNDVHPA